MSDPSAKSAGPFSFLKSKRFHSLLGLAVSVALIGWMVFEIDWHEVFADLRRINFWYLAPLTALFILHFVLRAWRWRYLLAGGENTSFADLWQAIMVGNFATYVLPLRAGEFVRPFMLSRRGVVSFSAAFTSVVIERFFDLIVVLGSFGVVLQFVEGIPIWVERGAQVLSLLAALIFVFIVVGGLLPERLVALARFATRPFPAMLAEKLLTILGEVLKGARVVVHPIRLLTIVLLSLIIWYSNFLFFQLYLATFQLEPSLLVATTVAVVVALAVAAPSAPGFIGVYETACIAGLALFGHRKETGAAFAIVSHAHQFLLLGGYGVFYLLKHNIRLGQLGRDIA